MSAKYSDSRFVQLSDKISKLKNYELKSTDLHTKFEAKIDKLEVHYRRTIKEYENRYNFIYEEIEVVTKIINANRDAKDRLKMFYKNEFMNLESKIKQMFQKEKSYITSSMNSLFNNIDIEIQRLRHDFERENEILENNIKDIKSFLDSHLPNLGSDIDQLSEDRRKKLEYINKILKEELSYLQEQVFIIYIV